MRVSVLVQKTPNPNAMKFTISHLRLKGPGKSYYQREDTKGNRLAERVMLIPGVASLFMVKDFISVQRVPKTDWKLLAPTIKKAIIEHFSQNI